MRGVRSIPPSAPHDAKAQGVHVALALLLGIGMSGLAGNAALPAETGVGLYPVDQLGGATRAVAVEGTRAYLGTGPRLTVWDLADAARPAEIGRSDPLPGTVAAVALAGGRAFVMCQEAARPGFSLHALNLADPARPRAVASIELEGAPMGIAAANGFLWVAAGSGGLVVVDARQVDRMRVVHRNPRFHALALVIRGSRAFVAFDRRLGGKFTVYDITAPDAPTVDGSFFLDAAGLGLLGPAVVAVNSAEQSVEIVALQFGADAALVPLARLPLDIAPNSRVEMAGSLAFVAGTTGVHVLDLSDPEKPIRLGRIGPPFAQVAGMALVGRRLWLAAGEAGLAVYDVGAGVGAALVAARPDLTNLRHVTASGDVLYAAGGNGGFWTLDIADRGRPRPLARVDLPNVQAVRVEPPLAYLACGRSGLFIVDVQDPARPVVLGVFKTPDTVTDVVVAGGFAYVAGGRSGLRVADVSDPRQPRFVGAVEDLADEPAALALADGRLFVAARSAGLRVFSLADPAAPVEIASYNTPDDAVALATTGATVYVGYSPGGLRAFEVAEAAPLRIRDYLLVAPLLGLATAEDRVLVAAGAGGARLVGWDDAGRLALAGSGGQVPGAVQAAAIAEGGYVYAAAGEHGLYTLAARPSRNIWLPLVQRR